MIVAVKTKTVQRAEVIAKRTGNIAEGFLKSQMIDLLKEKTIIMPNLYKSDGNKINININ